MQSLGPEAERAWQNTVAQGGSEAEAFDAATLAAGRASGIQTYALDDPNAPRAEQLTVETYYADGGDGYYHPTTAQSNRDVAVLNAQQPLSMDRQSRLAMQRIAAMQAAGQTGAQIDVLDGAFRANYGPVDRSAYGTGITLGEQLNGGLSSFKQDGLDFITDAGSAWLNYSESGGWLERAVGGTAYGLAGLGYTAFDMAVPGSLGEGAFGLAGGYAIGKGAGLLTRYAPELPVLGEFLGAEIGASLRGLTLLTDDALYTLRSPLTFELSPARLNSGPPLEFRSPFTVQSIGDGPSGAQWYGAFSERYGSAAVSWEYPSNRGFVYGADTMGPLESGAVVSRFGSNEGTFAAPYGTAVEARSLHPRTNTTVGAERVFFVERTILDVRMGPSAGAFDRAGYGWQFDFGDHRSIDWLIREGYLTEVTR